ncbi:DUF29 family protein, partial [Desulfobulbus sp. F5]|nr:DUF29 family protein [Desulfobulbus sp. F5]
MDLSAGISRQKLGEHNQRAAAADETGLPEQTFPKRCPWMSAEALNQDFW